MMAGQQQPQWFECGGRHRQRRCRHGQPCTCRDNQLFMTDAAYSGYNDPYQTGYGSCYGRRRRRQGPISMIIGGIISMVEQKRAEKEAVRASEASMDSDVSTSLDSDEDEKTRAQRQQKKLQKQQQGGTTAPTRASVPLTDTITPAAARERQQEQASGRNLDSKTDIHWESGPPAYRP